MMAITKDLEIRVNGDTAFFTEKFYVYQNDRGIDLYIKISMSRLQIGNKNISLLSELEGAVGAATILKPNKTIISKNELEIIDDTLRFTIDKSLTDELDEVGMYKLQFHTQYFSYQPNPLNKMRLSQYQIYNCLYIFRII